MGLVQQCPVLGFWSSLLGSLLRVEGWSCRGEGGRGTGGGWIGDLSRAYYSFSVRRGSLSVRVDRTIRVLSYAHDVVSEETCSRLLGVFG